jgi:hypothetical protein
MPVYQLSFSPWKSKEAMDVWRMAEIESMLFDYRFLDAWVQVCPCEPWLSSPSVIEFVSDASS